MATVLEMQQNALIRGTSCWLKAGKTNDAKNMKTVGFCDSFRGSKNLQIQRAQVCGSIYPVSLDPQGVSVQISVTGFIPTKKVMDQSNLTLNGKGENSVPIVLFNPDEKSFVENEQITKIPYICFYDENSDTVLATFKDCIVSTFNISVQGGSYVKGDMSMEAITMSNGTDYFDKTLAEGLELN